MTLPIFVNMLCEPQPDVNQPDIVVDDGDKALTQLIRSPKRVKRSRPELQHIGKSGGGHGTGHATSTSTKVRGAGATR